MSATAVVAGAKILGLLMDAAIGGLAVADAFAKFREGRDPGETVEDAAEEFAKEMLAQATGEDQADDALAAWRAKHG